MKRILSLLLALTLVFALVACSNEKDTTSEPDTSTITQTESTDNTETTDSDTTDESSSDTETPSNSTPTSTGTSKPTTSNKDNTTSNKDNTTSSKPSNTTSTPTTSKPTETSKPITSSTPSSTPSTPSHTHSWSAWKTETKALIGKDGTEKRTCSSCKETESRALTKEAAYNSFYDYELHWFMLDTIGISGGINSSNLITYFSQKYDGRDADPIMPSSSTVFNWLSSRFVLTDSLKEKMKQDARYNKSSDTFTLNYQGNCGDAKLIGYIHNGGSKYTVYYSFEAWGAGKTNYKVELEYNLLNGKPNRYISIEFVNAIPNNIIK